MSLFHSSVVDVTVEIKKNEFSIGEYFGHQHELKWTCRFDSAIQINSFFNSTKPVDDVNRPKVGWII